MPLTRPVYNSVEVDGSSLLLKGKGSIRDYVERISLSNISEVYIRKVLMDDFVPSKVLSIFEFIHKYGQNNLLRYDIDNRDEFIAILEKSGIMPKNKL